MNGDAERVVALREFKPRKWHDLSREQKQRLLDFLRGKPVDKVTLKQAFKEAKNGQVC